MKSDFFVFSCCANQFFFFNFNFSILPFFVVVRKHLTFVLFVKIQAFDQVVKKVEKKVLHILSFKLNRDETSLIKLELFLY